MKKYIIGLLAIILGVAGSAFTSKKEAAHVKKAPPSEWYFLFNSNSASDKFDRTKYIYINPQPASAEDVTGCDGQTLPCVILATGTQNGNPDASEVSDQTHLDAVTQTMKGSQP